jgi:hypothetical protein
MNPCKQESSNRLGNRYQNTKFLIGFVMQSLEFGHIGAHSVNQSRVTSMLDLCTPKAVWISQFA